MTLILLRAQHQEINVSSAKNWHDQSQHSKQKKQKDKLYRVVFSVLQVPLLLFWLSITPTNALYQLAPPFLHPRDGGSVLAAETVSPPGLQRGSCPLLSLQLELPEPDAT